MKKILKIAAILIMVALVMSACGSKDSVPNVKRIKNDILNNFEYVNSVENIKITETLNQKSTVGMLYITMDIDYTNKELESVHQNNAYILYNWDDSDGWKLSKTGSFI